MSSLSAGSMYLSGEIKGMSLTSLEADETKNTFFTPAEVRVHNNATDLWVSLLGHVYDLSAVVAACDAEPGLQLLLAHAGKDISHWFDPKTRDLKHHVDPTTGLLSPYLPQGPLLGSPPSEPTARWALESSPPWWKNDALRVGRLTRKMRKIRVLNKLTRTETVVAVAEEETLWEILRRYLDRNAHAASYAWKQDGRPLQMHQTLTENGIPDEWDEFQDLDMDADSFLPVLQLYFADDLSHS